MSVSLATLVRNHDFYGRELEDVALETLRIMEAAEAEAVPALLSKGGLLSLTETDGLNEHIDYILETTDPTHAKEQEVIDRVAEQAQLKTKSTEVSDAIYGRLNNAKIAAFCLGLAIGRRLS